MKVEIILPDEKIDPSHVYLEGMKGYPNQRCQPTITDQVAQFQLPLRDFYECGVTRIVYKLNVNVLAHMYSKIVCTQRRFNASFCCFYFQGKKVFYHKVIIESPMNKEFVSVKCITSLPVFSNHTKNAHSLTRRDVLPVGFEEPMYVKHFITTRPISIK